MSDEQTRWRRVKEIFHAAAGLDAAGRGAFLDEACAGDAELRREVESLLAADARGGSFLEAPAYEAAAELIVEAETVKQRAAATDGETGETRADEIGPPGSSVPAPPPRGRHPFFRVTLTLAALLVCYYAFAAATLYQYRGVTKIAGWDYGYDSSNWSVLSPDAEAAAAGLRDGDRIVAIDGDRRVAVTGPWLRLRATPPGRPFTLRVERGGVEHDVVQTPRVVRQPSPDPTIFIAGFVSLVYFVFGLLIGLLKPGERPAQVASLAALCEALYIVNPFLQYADGYGFLEGWRELVYFGAYFFHPVNAALFFHFFYRFPPGVRGGPFWSALRALLYALGGVLSAALRWREFVTTRDVETAMAAYYEHNYLFTRLFHYEDYYFHLVFLSILAVVVRNYRLVGDPDRRRRIKIVTLAALAYSAPPFLTLSLVRLAERFGLQPGPLIEIAYHTLMWIARAAQLLLPVAVAYAIVRHRVFDIDLVVRRGLQYLLARNALRAVVALPVVGLAWVVLSNPNRTLAEIVFRNSVYFYLLAAATAALTLKYRRPLTRWLDRKFFRETYDRGPILLALANRVQTCDSLEEISHLVSRQVEAALHPKGLHIFYRAEDDRELTLGYTSAARDAGSWRIPGDSRLLGLLERQDGARAYGELANSHALTPAERTWLERLGVDLLVPLAGADGRLAGLFLLGERKSEEPYAPADRRLLEAIAGQITVACENLRLRERVEREQKIRRDVLSRLDEGSMNLMRECPACGACYDSDAAACRADGRELQPSLPVGRTVEGKYRLEKLVGRGGMGAVYEATDLRLGRRVAVKIMTGSLFGDARALRRFQREARTCANLSHPNVVSVFDYGSLPAGGAYLVMELARGTTLREELAGGRRLRPDACAEIFDRVLAGVEAAHAGGVVHRDLKPENVLLARDGDPAGVKLLDFGIAKSRLAELSDSTTHTLPGTVLGTLGYMPPEQLTGEGADERSDLFSVGVMLYESLAGTRPFRGRTLPELLHAMQQGEPAPLPADLSACGRVGRALARSLAPDPAARYPTAAAMRAAIIPELRRCTSA
ncbi:MAG: protein kinase [Acidobacteria bacterium]|nr:protein kinase [Acidobacteriota bacterium]